MTMCTEKEIGFRIESHDLSELELNPVTRQPEQARMVKKYKRAAAGQEIDPEDVRPPSVLQS